MEAILEEMKQVKGEESAEMPVESAELQLQLSSSTSSALASAGIDKTVADTITAGLMDMMAKFLEAQGKVATVPSQRGLSTPRATHTRDTPPGSGTTVQALAGHIDVLMPFTGEGGAGPGFHSDGRHKERQKEVMVQKHGGANPAAQQASSVASASRAAKEQQMENLGVELQHEQVPYSAHGCASTCRVVLET